MIEPIIIDTQLYPDEVYEPLRKTLDEIFSEPKTLRFFAKQIKNECKKHKTCDECTFYDNDKCYPTCVLMVRSPEDWALEHLS